MEPLTKLGFPAQFPIVQFPNAPLIVALAAGVVARTSHGSGHGYASSVSYLALAIWAYEELVRGANWFRRLLGLAFVILTAVHLGMALRG